MYVQNRGYELNIIAFFVKILILVQDYWFRTENENTENQSRPKYRYFGDKSHYRYFSAPSTKITLLHNFF